MGSPRHSWLVMERGPSRRRAGGLVFVELLLILTVLILTVVLVSLVLGRVRHRAQLKQWGAELQAFSTALEAARAERGRWPATPQEAGSRLQDAGWAGGSPFGGEYGWIPPAAGRPGRITLTAFAPHYPLRLTPADLLAVDRAIDDGDLQAGRFRTGFNGWPVYLVNDRP